MPEIVEILDDGIGPFAERSQNTTIHDSGGPRWIGPTAAAALVALIAYGVATSTSTSGVPKVAQAPRTTDSPTTTRPTTLQPGPAITESPPSVPYYSADPPGEFRVQAAELLSKGNQQFASGDYQLWAMPGAAATTGSWFSINSIRTTAPSIYAVDASRVIVGVQAMAITHLPSGQSRIQFGINNEMSVTINSQGWGDEDLVRLTQSIRIGNRSAADSDVRPSDPTLIDDFQLLTTVPLSVAVLGNPVEQVYYSDDSDPRRGFSIGVEHLDSRRGDAGLAARRTALPFFLDHTTPFEVDGHSGVAGAIVGQPDKAVATWIAGDHEVSVVGTMSVEELITIARTVHQVSANDWDGMKFQASQNGNGLGGDYTHSEPRAVSFGTAADGGQWTVNVNMTTFADDQRGIDWQWSLGGGFGSTPHDVVNITTVVDGERTYVLAELPRAVAPTAQLQVVRTGLDPVLVPFNDTDASLDRTFAAYAFSEATDYTAQVIGPDGAVLATWPTL